MTRITIYFLQEEMFVANTSFLLKLYNNILSNSIIIGNNNISTVDNSIIIGNNIINKDYSLNIDNCICKHDLSNIFLNSETI